MTNGTISSQNLFAPRVPTYNDAWKVLVDHVKLTLGEEALIKEDIIKIFCVDFPSLCII